MKPLSPRRLTTASLLLCSSVCLSLAFACSTDDADPTDGPSGGMGGNDSSTGGSGTGGSGTGGTPDSSSGGEPGTAELAPPDCPSPVDLGVRIVGRHDGCRDGSVQMAWSGTGFVARFNGTGLTFTQTGPSIEYTIVVDGEVQPKLVTDSGEGTYEVASALDAGEHTVEIYRRSEASFGTVAISSVVAVGGELLPPTSPERRVEIFGDSITCGYGNEGADTSCSFSIDTENHYQTYGSILARQFDAALSTVAWSGKGVVVNYGGDMSTTLSEMVERAIPTASSVWDFSLVPEPDLVIINLGTNDFSTDNDPTPDDFTAGYSALLSKIRARYPSAYILATLGPLLTGSDLITAEGAIVAAIDARKSAGDDAIAYHKMVTGNPSPGCDWHPSIATHEAMADELAAVAASTLGW